MLWESSSTTMLTHLRRHQRVDHELRGFRRPEDDVDALAGEFLGDGLDARTTHADAGPDRIDPLDRWTSPRSSRGTPHHEPPP
jgi:hypothetical protein